MVDAIENAMIGEPLKVWDDFLSLDPAVPNDERKFAHDTELFQRSRPVLTILKGDFSVTIPDGLPAECSEAGNCVIQWYWYATSNEQTYISCLDFELA